jgi:hypothetical protein
VTNIIYLPLCIALFFATITASASADQVRSGDAVDVLANRTDSARVRRTIDDLAVFERFVADHAAPFSTPDRTRNDLVLGATVVIAIAALAQLTAGNQDSGSLHWLPSPWIGCNLAGATVGGSWQ